MSKFYITTAIAYVNGKPHMGHALEFIMTDTIARYKRLMGDDVYFLTGTDEHGVKNFTSARKEGLETQEFVDKNAQTFIDLKDTLDLSYDNFIRTTNKELHYPACQKLWKQLVKKADIYKKEYEGVYCEGCEAFLSSRDLADGMCPDHKKAPQLIKEENYFFRLSKYSDKIAELLESDKLRIIPSLRKNEIMNMVKDGLHDVSFSRPNSVLPWGVPVPDDPDQVMYVWCDALTNYISALGYKDNSPEFKKFWPADVHVIGKDIVRFHAGIWIGMLLSAGLPIPKGIFVHGFITHNGEKMSKTLRNVVDPVEVTEKFGKDALRYYLLREIPSGRDGDFNDDLFVDRYNSDLANNLGNLVNRVHTLVSRNNIDNFDFTTESESFKSKTDETWKKYVKDMNAFNIHEAVFHVWRLLDFANKVMEEEKPWTLLKTDPDRGKAILCNVLELIRHVTIMINPFIPSSSERIRKMIGLSEYIDIESEEGWGSIEDWVHLGEGEIIFPRI